MDPHYLTYEFRQSKTEEGAEWPGGVMSFSPLYWRKHMLPNGSGTAEEYGYSLQVTFRIVAVFLLKAAARNGPGNLLRLPPPLKLLFIHALSIWGLA